MGCWHSTLADLPGRLRSTGRYVQKKTMNAVPKVCSILNNLFMDLDWDKAKVAQAPKVLGPASRKQAPT